MPCHFFVITFCLNESMGPKKWITEKNEILRKKRLEPVIEDAFCQERMMLENLKDKEIFDYMVSKMNFCSRKELLSCRQMDVIINVGDICYIDFGMAYQHEIGYLHFGIIMAKNHGKVFVVPMTGNEKAYMNAYDRKKNVHGKRHLMRLGFVEGMDKLSVLFINDSKWINSARIIDVKGHVSRKSELFKEIQRRIFDSLDV